MSPLKINFSSETLDTTSFGNGPLVVHLVMFLNGQMSSKFTKLKIVNQVTECHNLFLAKSILI